MELIEQNVTTAQVLRYLADYIEMSDSPAKVKIGIKFKIKNLPVVNVPVQPVEQASKVLGAWVSEDIIRRVEQYQKLNETDEGAEILEQFKQARDFFKA